MKNRLPFFLVFILALGITYSYPQSKQLKLAVTQDTLRFASWNLLNYPGSDASTRQPYYRRVIHSMKPDIFVVQEMTSSSGVTTFRDEVMNKYQAGLYSTPAFHDGTDTDNHIYYKSSKVSLVGWSYIATALRDIAHYVVQVNSSGDRVHIYSVHLKASTGFESDRLAEATILRDSLNNLPAGTQFMIVGDYNTYTSTEPCLQKLYESEADNDGRCKDPLNSVGSWNNNSAFKSIHTQSPRVRAFGGGSTGGMDDRFDIQLICYSALDDNILTSHYTAYGNDGNHFNDSINRLPNAAVPDSVANGIHYAADHIPVYCDYVFIAGTLPSAFSMLSPSNLASNQPVNGTLSWQTSTNATQYDVYLSTTNPPTTVVSSNQTDTTYNYSGLSNNIVYYWKIVAKNTDGNTTASSSPRSFTTIVGTPGSFSQTSPSNSSVNQPAAGTLSWQSSASASGYDVYLDTNDPPAAKVSSNQAGTTYNYSGLNYSTIYYWKIVARNIADTTIATGAPWNFTTIIAPPSSFTLSSPADNAVSQPVSGTLVWNSSLNASSYDVYLDTNDPPTTLVSADVADTSYAYTNLTTGVEYFWKTLAKNINTNVVASNAPFSFTIVNVPLPPSGLAASNVTTTGLDLNWTDNATDETGYRIYRSTSAGGPFTQMGGDYPVDQTSFSDTGLNVNQEYYYRVLAFNGLGEGNFTPISVATLALVPGTPVLSNIQYITSTLTLDPALNPSSTQFAVEVLHDAATEYLQSDGTPGGSPSWRTYAEWGGASGVSVSALHSCEEYTFHAKARNADDVETVFGGDAVDSTLCFSNSNMMLAGWNLVSVPVTVADLSRSAVFPTSTSNAFAYEGSYVPYSTFSYGTGYWLKFSGSQKVDLAGEPRTLDSITVKKGWSIIGSISVSVPVGSITTVPSGIIASQIYNYNGVYNSASSIDPMQGYWVKTSSAGKTILSGTLSALPKNIPSKDLSENKFSGFHPISFTDKLGHQQTLYVGAKLPSGDALSKYELPPVPPSGFDVRFSSQRTVEVMNDANGNEGKFEISVQSLQYPVTVSWNASDNDIGFQFREKGSSELKPAGTFLITKNTSLFLKATSASSSIIPKEFALYQNYPNPFNPATTISYQLPVDARVSLKIFNMLGQEIAVLADDERAAGNYQVRWNAESVASGMYVYQLLATDQQGNRFTERKKLLLLK